MKFFRKAQTSMEFMILVIIVLGALLAVGSYFKRGIQGRWKSAVDDLGDQYDPRVAETDITHRVRANGITTISTLPAPGGFWSTRQDYTNTVESKTGTMRVGGY